MMPVAPPPEHLNRPPLDPPEQFCRPLSLAEILSATHNFDESLVIGQGGFGKVYKGVIDNGASIVAVKRLSHESKQGDSEFRTEIEMLLKFRHSHIVSLIGYCYSSTEMILVYQYMANGSLADHLYKSGKYGSRLTLSWVQRLKICLGAARGLDYLHTGIGVQDSIIHRDMKSSNILLDKNFAAKVSDFGLSRICPIDQSCTHIKTNVKGTTGYVDPEYMLTFKLTRKSDVYSFGVVLFEVLCGRRAVDFSLDEEQWSLATWAQYCIEKETLHRIVDPNLRWEILPESFTEFARIANQCLCYQSEKRPTMTQVVASLDLALTLQLAHKDSSSFEMEIIGASEADGIKEMVDSTMVQKDAIKSGSRDEDNNDVPPSHVKPREKKGLSKMLQLFMFWTEAGPSRIASKTSNPSARSSLTNSYSERSSVESLPTPRSEGKILSSSNVKAFSFNELRNATRNFRPDSFLGEGRFGYVFKGCIDEHMLTAAKPGFQMLIAVKKLKSEGFQGHREWLTEINYLGQLYHPNLVKLIGYCSDGDNRLLVYDFMPKGSLENHLFIRGPQPLSWATRIKVAIGAARGLSFLHDAEAKVIYRDFKASKILLDAEFNVKLSDFGLAEAGPTGDRTHVSTQVMGTRGYAAPEYVATGRLTAESDVYSFGVVLLELLSGRRAFDKTMVGIEQNLVDWAEKNLADKRKLFRIMDPYLEGQYHQKGAYTCANLALQCLSTTPKARPRMAEVLAMLEDHQALYKRFYCP